jgi:two-component system, OmpR family, KDP operon response regulator KdpE
MSRVRILVVDDEPQIQRFLKPALTASDYDVISAGTGREARHLAVTRAPDLVILDLGLPDQDGKELIAHLRAFSALPIIVLSARGQEQEKIDALDAGADDYVEKPFSIAELLARIRTSLRRRDVRTMSGETMIFGDLKIDTAARFVERGGERVHLTPKEYELLVQLAQHAGRVLTHRQLLTAIWGPAHLEDVQYLRVTIAQLRAKIEGGPNGPRLILNEPAVGYRFVAQPS